MPELSEDAKQKVLALKRAYIDSLPEKIQQLRECWQRIESSQFAHHDVVELRGHCHKIAGSSGSYELPEIARAAHDLELLCASEYKDGSDSDVRLRIEGVFHTLVKRLQHAKLEA